MYLKDILEPGRVEELVEAGYITSRTHPEYPLAILNYSDQAQFDNVWNTETTTCRGLIYNYETNEVIARPFPKFFNWDHGQQKFPPSGPVLRMEKLDGSLGILVPISVNTKPGTVETHWEIATRGSFVSDQAKWATKWLWEQEWFLVDFEPDHTKTYLFEIIYPANRVVVDYGGFEGLVLIDVIDNETGFSDTAEFDECGWPEKVKRIPMGGFDSGQVVDIPEGDEGFVYLWPTRNFRTKMKSAQYIELHKLVTGLNEKVIWQGMMAGKSINQIVENIPDEFHEWVGEVYDRLETAANAIDIQVEQDYREIMDSIDLFEPLDRKEFAAKAFKYDYPNLLFSRLDNRNVFMLALKSLKPKIVSQLVTEH